MGMLRPLLLLVLLPAWAGAVKELFSAKEFKDLLAEAGGRPIVLDFYSQSCGPCHMIAPKFRQLSKEFKGKAYFRKVDVNRNTELASAQSVRSMPTFQFWMKGKKRHQFAGADERQMREWTKQLVDEADKDDVIVTFEALEEFYQKHDPSKATKEGLEKILQKNTRDHSTMVKLLKKKYGEGPKTQPRPRPSKEKSSEEGGAKPSGAGGGGAAGGGGGGSKPNLQAASLEELKQELERREEEVAEAAVEEEERRLLHNPCSMFRNRTAGAIEKVLIIGGGPSGMTAAIYAARSNLCPLLIAPALGGQLLAKGVDVENYPGLPRENGGKMISIMKTQARSFFTEVWDDSVMSVNTAVTPFEIVTNRSGLIRAHMIIVATGADSKWLDVSGEWEFRGFGVSSCAACDGYLYKGKACAVVGGGDTAMEEALMLSRLCSSVQLIHRRDSFRASLVLVNRVLNNPNIQVRWNSQIHRFVGRTLASEEGASFEQKELTHIQLQDTRDPSKELVDISVDAAFIAIGHDPNTKVFAGKVDMDATGYILTKGTSTKSSVPGVFAAGDVADHVYRQAVTSAGSGAMAAMDAERWLSENPIENEETCVRQEDFATWSVKDLRAQVNLLGLKCVACTEKSDFITSLKASY